MVHVRNSVMGIQSKNIDSRKNRLGGVRQKRMDDAMEASAIYTHTPYLYKQIAYFYSQQLTLFFYQFCWPNSNNHKTNFVEFSIFNFTALHFACCQQTLEVHSQNCILGVYTRSPSPHSLALVALFQFLSLFKPAILWLIPPKCGPHFALFIPSISALLSLTHTRSIEPFWTDSCIMKCNSLMSMMTISIIKRRILNNNNFAYCTVINFLFIGFVRCSYGKY